MNIEYNYKLQNSKIQQGWYSALWTINKLPNGHLVIRSKWKPNKYISINSSGATLANDKYINTSGVESPQSLLGSIFSFFISAANAEEIVFPPLPLQFGESLAEMLKWLDNRDMWQLKMVEEENTTKKVLLLLHGLNSNPETWANYVKKSEGNNCTMIYDGFFDEKLGDQSPYNDPSTTCYAIKFGSFDKSMGLTGIGQTTCLKERGCSGDYSSYSDLAKEIEMAINHIIHPTRSGSNVEIILLGHSRGGLAARAYLQGSYKNSNLVKGLITTVTPHGGSRLASINNWFGICYETESIYGCENDKESYFDILEKGGLDLKSYGVGILSPTSRQLMALNANVGNLPDIEYIEMAYSGQYLGDIAYIGQIMTFNPLPSIGTSINGMGYIHQFSIEAENYILRGRGSSDAGDSFPGKTNTQLVSEDYSGDGIVSFDSQHLSKLLNGHSEKPNSIKIDNIETMPYENESVVHTKETNRIDDLNSAVSSMKTKLGW